MERTSDYPPRQAKVAVCEWEDERIEIRYKGKARMHREIEAPKPQAAIRLVDKPSKLSSWKPPSSHPWRRPGSAALLGKYTVLEEKKGDASIEVSKGTFLKWVDTLSAVP